MGGYPLPWVYRPVKGRVLTKMPYGGGSNRGWLHEHLGNRIRPEHWCRGVWAIARPRLRYLVEGLAERFGHVDVVLDFRQSERCDTQWAGRSFQRKNNAKKLI